MNGIESSDLQKLFEQASAEASGQSKGIEVDLMSYVSMLEGVEGTLEQKLEFLRSLGAILMGVIDLGFEVVFTEESCGKVFEPAADPAQEGQSAVDSEGYERRQR